MNYQQGPEGVAEQIQTSNTPETVDAPALAEDASNTADRMGVTADNLSTRLDALGDNPGIEALSTEEALSIMDIADGEREAAANSLPEGASEQEVMQQVFDSRVETLSDNQITIPDEGSPSGERQLSEADLIAEIAGESGVNAELIGDLRALGFEGAQDWAPEDVAENLEDMAEQLKMMKEQLGENFPENKEEFLALYEALNQNDAGDTNNHEIDPSAAAANGIDAIRDSNGGFQINPDSEGYRQVGDMVVGAPGAPFSRGGQVYTGTGEISRAVNANLDTSYNGLSQNPGTEMSAEFSSQLNNPENKETIEKVVPAEWHGAAVKLANKEGNPLNPSYPIMIASMTEKRGIVCYPDGRVDDFPIIIGSGGYREGAHSGGNTTPTYEVFNMNMNTKVTGEGVDASNSGSSTVLGASIQSPQGAESGGKWWHGVAQSRIPGGATAGCIGGNQNSMMIAGRAVLEAGGGYGFNVNQKTG